MLDGVDFDTVESSLGDLDESVWKDLSRDQQLLYRWTKAVESGVVPDNLAGQVAGPVYHSRWLTLAVRLLQLYTKTAEPSQGLRDIVRYIVQVYSPGWFYIKCHYKFTHEPANLFYQMKLIKTQPLGTQAIVTRVVQRNAYFADPGVMLCGMLESELEVVRSKAISIIKTSRSKPPKPPRAKVLRKIRKFQIPLLEWDAEAWCDVIDWSKVKVFEPEILSRLSIDTFEGACDEPLCFPRFPCHSQSVERAVKLVTEAASKVCGGDKRHSHSVSVLAARKARTPFKSKKHYRFLSMDS